MKYLRTYKMFESEEFDDLYTIGNSYAEVTKSKESWNISYIESRNKGDGTILMNKIIFDAKSNKIKNINLQTGNGSDTFFEKFGFKVVDKESDGYTYMQLSLEISEADYDNDLGGKFWGNRGAGVLPICKSTGRILVAMRSPDVNEPNTWGIFGGKIDNDDETPEDAAKRELAEETGYDGHVEIVPAYVWKSPDSTFVYSNFIGIVDEEFEPEYDWETSYAEWMTLAELKDLSPKHFGLKALVKNSLDVISKYAS